MCGEINGRFNYDNCLCSDCLCRRNKKVKCKMKNKKIIISFVQFCNICSVRQSGWVVGLSSRRTGFKSRTEYHFIILPWQLNTVCNYPSEDVWRTAWNTSMWRMLLGIPGTQAVLYVVTYIANSETENHNSVCWNSLSSKTQFWTPEQ